MTTTTTEAFIFEAKGTRQKIVMGPFGRFATERMHVEAVLSEMRAQATKAKVDPMELPSFAKAQGQIDVFYPVSVFNNDGSLGPHEASVELTKNAQVLFSDPRVKKLTKAWPDNDDIPAQPGFTFEEVQKLVVTPIAQQKLLGFDHDDAAKAVDMTERVSADSAWGDDEDEDASQREELIDRIKNYPPEVQVNAVKAWLEGFDAPPKLVKAIINGVRKTVERRRAEAEKESEAASKP